MRILRRLLVYSILSALAVVAYMYGRARLWPPADTSQITAVGMIEAPEVNITSRIAGRIVELDLLEGDHVTRGQVVCRIESVDLRNRLRRAQADLAHAEANLKEARRDFARYRQLFTQHIVSPRERDAALTQLEQAQAAMASARANVSYFRDQLADTRITSPVDGVVVNKALEVGEWVRPGTPILTVDNLSTIWARVDIQETDLPAIYVGKPAQVTLPTHPRQSFTGRVMAIGQEGQFATERDVRRGRQDIRTFYVKVQVLQADGQAKPGMTAEVSFQRHHDGSEFSSNNSHRPD